MCEAAVFAAAFDIFVGDNVNLNLAQKKNIKVFVHLLQKGVGVAGAKPPEDVKSK